MPIIKMFTRQFMSEANAGDAGPAAGGSPAPLPAPAPAPVPAPAPEPKAPDSAPPAPAIEFAKTGRPGVDAFGSFLAANGIGMEHPAFQAADNGDFALLKAELMAKGIPGTEAMIALAEAEYAAAGAEAEQRQQAEEHMMLEVFGGDQDFADTVLDWARENAEPHEKEAVNAAFEAGGIQAQMAAVWLREMHKLSGNTVAPQSPMQPNASTAMPSNPSMTAAEYQQLVSEGVRKFGPQWIQSDQAIMAARRLRG